MNIPTTSGQPVAKLGSAQSAFHVINSPGSAHPSVPSPQGSPAATPLTPGPVSNPVAQLLHQFRLQQQRPVISGSPILNLSSNRNCADKESGCKKMYPHEQDFFAEAVSYRNDYSHTVTVTAGMTSPHILESPDMPSTAAASSGNNFLCQICSDRATGKHYGASSCDGCKGFFRRTIRKQQEYKCRFDKNCVIDKDKRNTCRFCRFQKCVNAGMMRNAVQSERDSISVKRKRSSSTQNRSSSSSANFKEEKTKTKNVNNNNNNVNNQHSATTSPPLRSVSVDQATTTTLQPATSSVVVIGGDSDRAKVQDAVARRRFSMTATTTPMVYGADHVYCPPSTPEDQLAALKQAEHLFVRQQSSSGACTPNLSAPSTPASSSSVAHSPGGGAGFFGAAATAGGGGAKTRLATVEDLADSIKEQLLLLVEWAKALPPFIELSLDDQVSLLRSYSAEHLLLGVARRSLPYKGVLLLSNDACIPRHHSSNIHDVNHVVFRILDELVEPMRELQLDDTEIGCLKALLFFNPNASGLVNKFKVKETRQQFLTAFHEYVTTKRSQVDKVRFGSLLLLLPPLQAMSQQFVEDLQLASLFGIKTFDKLLEELLLATASSAFLADGINAVAKKFSDNQQVEQNGGQMTSSSNNNNMIDLTCLDSHNVHYGMHHQR